MSKSTTGYADIGNAKLYYEIGGEGETLVLLHAGFVDSGMWDDQWDDFTKHYRVIRFDMRGYGKSDAVDGPASRRDDLLKLLQQLGVEKTHLLGCSMGGEIVIDFTLDHPEMVTSLIVVGAVPSGFEMQGEPPRYMLEMMEAAKRRDTERVSDLQIRIMLDGTEREPEDVDPKVRQRAIAMNQTPVKQNTYAADEKPLNPLDPPAAGRLGEIKVPVLPIVGSLDHSEMSRASDVMAAEIPNAHAKVVIADAGHVASIEKPAEFNRIVLNFLNGLE